MKKGITILMLALLITAGAAFDATASNNRNPGSLLLFPFFNTDETNLSVISITNTGPEDVWVRIVWVCRGEFNGYVTCDPSDTWVLLTRNDTFCFFDSYLFFENCEGFSYMYAVDDQYSESEICYNYLIGQEIIFCTNPGDDPKYVVNSSVNAVSFQANNPNGDGLLELNGIEYNLAPHKLYFPRFFGQPDLNGGGNIKLFESWIVFINLTGGKYYNATIKMLIFNDNEIGFSKTVQVPCWDTLYLNELSGCFENSFLSKTDHDPDEPLGFNYECGWFCVWGEQAWYDTNFIDDPSVYAVLIESIGGCYGVADLPFQTEDNAYDHGKLWYTGVNPLE